MTDTRTLYVRLSDLPLDEAARWLSAEELAAWSSMRSPARQATWLGGRIVAKRLLLELLAWKQDPLMDSHATSIQIDSRSMRTGHGERPEVSIAGRRVQVALSIAHTERGALAAAALNTAASALERLALGVDLVTPTDAGRSLSWTFTDAERLWLAHSADYTNSAARIWAMKEAIYKASQRGEGFSPRDIDVAPGQPTQYPQRNAGRDRIRLQSWCIDGHVAALAIVKDATTTSVLNDLAITVACAA
jgi:phosphopantetheinyl transferase